MSSPTVKVDAVTAGAEGVKYENMFDVLQQATMAVKNQMESLAGRSNISIVQMFELQMRMNKLSQLSEMSANVLSSMNGSINSMARGIK